MTPSSLTGAWRRHGIAFDGGEAVETSNVVWLQAGDVFADLRMPATPEGAPASFAGSTTWDGNRLRWVHELDLSLDAADDVATLRHEDGDLLESGTAERGGREVGYVERWRRLPGSGSPSCALARVDGLGLLVQAGDHVLTVADDRPLGGGFRACYRAREAGVWQTVLALGDRAGALPGPPPDQPSPDTLLQLDGHTWQVAPRINQLA